LKTVNHSQPTEWAGSGGDCIKEFPDALNAFSTFKYCLMIPNGAVANVLRATGRARHLSEFSTKTPVDD
jgi:dTDP-4-amino-4,6-dideoxygalactose transaminase